MSEFLNNVSKEYKVKYEQEKRLLSFQEYLDEVEKNPSLHFRNSAQYLIDTFDHFGKETVHSQKQKISRFKLFNAEFDTNKTGMVIGEEEIQNKIYQVLQNFSSSGLSNKFILLHGPNGSSKTSIINAITNAMEHYSHTDTGALYKYNWVFPLREREKGRLGFHETYDEENSDKDESYAKMDPLKILSKLSCDVKDSPLFLLPKEKRHRFIERLKEKDKKFASMKVSNYLLEGQLCQKCSQIFEALLASYDGDYEKVLSHVEVERIYVSKRYNSGTTTIEPQLHVDATSSMVTYDKSLAYLPPVLQHMNFYVQTGPLINASRGVLEFSDLLKRPLDTWKYLLSLTETSSININQSTCFLDMIIFGTCNESHLDAFKKTPEFSSFKGRMELIRVPYLLEYDREKIIYDHQLKQICHEKHITPYTTSLASLWAVLTRIKKPDNTHYSEKLKPIVDKLDPLHKAFLYNNVSATPQELTPEEKNELVGSLIDIIHEYSETLFYEGRVGASPREIKNIILNSLQNPEFKCLSPFAIFHELAELTKKKSEYEFLNIEPRGQYHDVKLFLSIIQGYFLKLIEGEILNSLGFYNITDYEKFLHDYIMHVTHYVKKEKIRSQATRKAENPDETLMQSFENQVGGIKDTDEFRKSILSTIGAYKIDNPTKDIGDFKEVFPAYFKKLQEYNYNKHKERIEKLKPELEEYLGKKSKGETKLDNILSDLVTTTITNLVKNHDYCEHCAPEILYYFVKTKYSSRQK